MLKAFDRCKKLFRGYQCLHITALNQDETKTPKRKVKETTELITLIDNSDKVLGIRSKTDSQKLARKRNMLLEKIEVHKYGKVYPVYKLVSSAEILAEDVGVNLPSGSKTIKKISFSNRITDHDFSIKVKTIKKLLAKKCEVHVAVTGSADSGVLMDSLYEKISMELQNEARILDKRIKNNALKFIVVPQKQQKN